MSDDFELYDVTAVCKFCGANFMTKSFAMGRHVRLGLCRPCWVEDAKRRLELKQPPND